MVATARENGHATPYAVLSNPVKLFPECFTWNIFVRLFLMFANLSLDFSDSVNCQKTKVWYRFLTFFGKSALRPLILLRIFLAWILQFVFGMEGTKMKMRKCPGCSIENPPWPVVDATTGWTFCGSCYQSVRSYMRQPTFVELLHAIARVHEEQHTDQGIEIARS